MNMVRKQIKVEGGDNCIVVYNSLSWVRTDVVSIVLNCTDLNFNITDKVTGKSVAYTFEKLDDGSSEVSFLANEIPALGYKLFSLNEVSASINFKSQNIKSTVLKNKHFQVEFNSQGNISSIYDEVYKRELIEGGTGNKIQIFEDRPGKYSAWDIIPTYKEYEYSVIELKELNIIEDNNFRTVMKLTRRVINSTVTQRIILYNDIHRVDFDTHVDWKEKEKLLKVAFPVSVRTRNATYDIPFGTIQRPTHESTSWDKAKFEVCAHKWADLSEADFGIALLNDCKYGYDIRENVMRLTLLKSPIYPDPVSDMGEHEFKFSLYPHTGDWRQGKVMQEAYSFNVPFDALEVKPNEGSLCDQAYSWMQVDAANVILETLKEPEDSGEGMVVRIYDSFGQRGKVEISTEIHSKSAQEVNLIEKPENELILEEGCVNISYKPYEIKTIRYR